MGPTVITYHTYDVTLRVTDLGDLTFDRLVTEETT